MAHHLSVLAVLSLLGLTACNSPAPPSEDAGTQDADQDEADSDVDLPGLFECGFPGTGFGYATDDVLEPFLLSTCDGQPSSLSRLWCGNDVTIVHLSATWCHLCHNATTILLRDVMAHLEGESVTLVEILLEGEEHGVVADGRACDEWSTSFAPEVETFIPPNETLDGALAALGHELPAPTTLVIDSEGVIRFRSQVVIPDYIESQTHQVLVEVQELLDNERY